MPSFVNFRRSAVLLGLGVIAIALYDLAPAAILQSVVYEGLGTLAVVSVAVRARRSRGCARIGFALVAIGIGCWVSGDVASDVIRFTSGDAPIRYPSIADLMYVLGYGIALGGAAILARDVFGRPPLLPVIDGAIAAATFLVVAWAAIKVGGVSAGSTAQTLGVLLYPTLDVLMLAAGVRMFGCVWRSRALLLVAVGLLAMLAADLLYAISAMSYTIGRALDDGWLLAYLCFAVAACGPMAAVTRAIREELRFRPIRLVLVGLALVATNVAATIGAHAVDTEIEMIVTGLCSVALAGLVIARMAVVLRAHDRARLREKRARTEALAAQREAEAARGELAAEHDRLLDSESRFRAIFEHAGLAMVLVGADREVIAANPGALRLFRVSSDELRALGAAGLTHPDDVSRDQEQFGELMTGARDTYTTEKRYHRRDGSIFSGRLTYSVARRDDGSAVFAIAIIDDVTKIRDAERAVVRSERRLEQMFQDARIAMALTNRDGRYVRANTALCTLLGYTEDELRGKTFGELTHPDDVAKSLDSLRALLAGEIDSFETEKRYIRRDGGVISTLLTVSLVHDPMNEGEPLFSSQILDVTARVEATTALRESERRLRAIVENTVEGIVVVDDEARIDTANPAACAITGRPLPALVGTAFDELLGAREPFARIRTAIRSGHDVTEAELVVQTPAGVAIPVQLSFVTSVLPSRHLLIMRDLSEQRALEADRQRLDQERRIAQRLEAVGQLAAGIAHEINTPLQFVGDSVVFLREANDELLTLTSLYRETLNGEAPVPVEERRRAMREAEENADIDYLCERIPVAFARTMDGVDRVRSIVQAMKRFSHDSGTEFAPADLNEALETTLAVCRNEYKYVADVVTELSGLPLIDCNIGELNQVFLNLIVNAAHAIQDKVGNSGERGVIRIHTWLEGPDAVVEIADDGPGIPIELQERIYEPFFTTKKVGKGTGQGLALARNTIDRHAGSLQCSSAPGDGATFTIRLPARTEPQRTLKAA